MAEFNSKKDVNAAAGLAGTPDLNSQDIELREPEIQGTLPGLPEGLIPASALNSPLTVVVPAWDNLPSEGAIDKLSLEWRRQNTSNAFNPIQTYEIEGPLTEADFPYSVAIDAGKLDYEEGTFDVRYHIVSFNGGTQSYSKIVPLVIDRTPPYKHAKPSKFLLPATQITIPFFEANNDEFVCVIPDYADYQDGDELVYFWRTATGSKQIGRIPVPTDRKIVYTRVQIEASQNGECFAEYQIYDKSGNNSPVSESEPIEVNMAERSLSYVKVQGASGSSQYGSLKIDFANNGVKVTLPAEADIYEGEKARLQWADPMTFNAITVNEAESTDPWVFHVPKANIAAHMVSSLPGGAKYIPVYYEVLDGSGSTVVATSKVYNLSISDVPAANYPPLQCDSVKSDILSLASVPSEGAVVSIGYWAFMAADQFVSFRLVGLGLDDKNLTVDYFPNHAVTAEEVTAEKVSTIVAKTDLEKFKVGTQISFEGCVSFNNKDYWYNFRRLWANLVN